MHLKILSVDDSVTIAEHLKDLVNDIDGVTLTAHTFTIDEALGVFKTETPDVVILDLALKEESGLDFLAYLKKNHVDTKVIILTNQADLFYKNKSKEMGADYFLDKSYEFDKLPEILKKLESS
jgi:DNA-binding response OmpR family regulator